MEREDIYHSVNGKLEDINDGLIFHRIVWKSGYYSGAQFYVDELYDPNEYDNSDCHYYFDDCRSVAIRKYEREQNKVKRILAKLAEEYNFEKYAVSARFSNGETWYTKIA
jgi:hypothetical protein